jgi:pimeloyl-ACP methyl ester carboxylesterase
VTSAPAPPLSRPRQRWLLLRGLLREVGHWGQFLQRWQAHFPGDEVQALDLPGCGAFHGTVAPGRVSDLLAFVRSRSGPESPGVDSGPLWLVGLSLGGMVVTEWRQRHPQEVAGAVIISSSARGLCPPWHRLRPRGAWHLLRAALARSLPDRERQVFLATSALSQDQEAVVSRWVEVARARPVSAGNAARLLLAANRFRISSDRPAIVASPPALVLAAEGDALVHPACSRALALALDAELQLHPRAGHDLPLDDPAWVLAAVAGWRLRLPGPPAAVRGA